MTTSRLYPFAAVLGLMIVSAHPAPVDAAGCGFEACGTNSAEILGVPLNGISVAGLANVEGHKFVPGSLTLRPNSSMPSICTSYPGTGYGIGVVDGALVGISPRGGEIIPSACLLRGTFALDVIAHGTVNRVQLIIAQRGSVSTWHVTLQRAELPTYEILDADTGVSVCPLHEAWMEPWQVGGLNGDLSNPSGVRGAQWHAGTDHALIVQGETYLADARIDGGRSSSDWFNIACAGSALAKSRLMGYDPMATTSTAAQRQSTLKMLTAHYVPRNAHSWTQTGTPLIWISNPEVAYYGTPNVVQRNPYMEAYWDANGATCISHLRLYNRTTNEPATLATIRQLAGFGACDSSLGPPPGTLWTTITVNHIH